jgi:hypothetical protein
MVLHLLPLPMPPALRLTCSITPPAPSSKCRGIYRVGFFGPALTFAALSLRNKGMYNHVADFCEQWNEVIDVCNGRHGPHSPDNAVMQQTRLLDTLVWFSRWKDLHDERVRAKLATEYNFFANKTWFCIKSLLLAHITVIQIYCVMKGESISPRTMNTDTVEWFFGDARQMVGGSTNKLTAAGFDRADKILSSREQFYRSQHVW